MPAEVEWGGGDWGPGIPLLGSTSHSMDGPLQPGSPTAHRMLPSVARTVLLLSTHVVIE